MCFPTQTTGVVPEEPDFDLNEKDQPTRVQDIASIKRWEGLRLEAYMPTPNDVPTIGYGHTHTAKMGMVITEAEAERLLRVDLKWAREAVNNYVTVPLTQPQYDALVSFVFNVGATAFRKSTMLRKLNASDFVGAANEFPRWNKQKGKVLRGLTNRRLYEKAKFLSGTEQ